MTVRWRTLALLGAFLAPPAWAQVPAEMHQEGLLQAANGIPLEGPVDLRFRLYQNAAGGAALWTEDHRGVEVFDGYYSVLLGSQRALDPTLVAQARFLTVAVDGGAELLPRVRLASVPFALLAQDVIGGKVDARNVRIAGNLVIDDQGRWVGDPAGLQGPQGPQGVAGPAGPQGPQGPQGPAGVAGAAGGNGSPDTPAQVRDKLAQVDGAGSGIDADRLDGLDATQFMRADRDTGTTGRLSAGNGLSVTAGGQLVAEVTGGPAGSPDTNRLTRLRPQDGATEGGHLELAGAANQQDWAIDTQNGNLRFYEPGPSSAANKTEGNVLFFRPGGDISVNITGNLSAKGLSGSQLTIAGRPIIDSSGKLNQAQWDLQTELRVLTNTVGALDHNMYINYPNRPDSQTYLYNDPIVSGTLTVTGNVLLGGSRLFDVGITETCEANGGALGACGRGGQWRFGKIAIDDDAGAVAGRMAALPAESIGVAGEVRADGEIRTASHMRVGGNLHFGSATIYADGTVFTCERSGGVCPNSGFWTFDKIVLEHNHADVAARMAATPTGSMNVENQIRADGDIISGNNIIAAGQVQVGTSALRNGELRLGAAANQRLSAAQLTTLVGGGNADALHTHAGLGANPWVRIGNLNDYFGLAAQYPHTEYEFGVTYNTSSILPVTFTGWNGGTRVIGKHDYLIGDRFPWEGGNYFNMGGAIWLSGTQSGTDNGCNAAGQWYHQYYHWVNGTLFWVGSNGCSVPSLFVRRY